MVALEDSVVVVSAAADAAQLRVLADPVVQAADSVEAGSVEVELLLSRQSFSAAMARSTT